MNVKATAKFVRMSPQKTRLVVSLIRSLPVEVAKQQLMFSKKEAAQAVLKVLNSALANASHNFGLDVSNFFVVQSFADEGPKFYRHRARARGSAAPIRKRMSHITIAVGPKDGEAVIAKPVEAKVEAPKKKAPVKKTTAKSKKKA